MAVGDTGADSAWGWRERVRGGTKELRGEVARLGARGIEARRREVAGIGTGAASGVQLGLLGSAVHSVHGRGKGNGEAKANLASHSATCALKRRWWSSARRVAMTTSRPAVL